MSSSPDRSREDVQSTSC